ncbi:hypothetical protein, partial [Burkholderia orbicola]|uniref:hypothetical protein n=1 Tax=Burkholderia orbicola TaxID=2978683 RepID=UPI002FE1D84E
SQSRWPMRLSAPVGGAKADCSSVVLIVKGLIVGLFPGRSSRTKNGKFPESGKTAHVPGKKY